MTDIITALRNCAARRVMEPRATTPVETLLAAADEITRLRAEVEQARATGEYWKAEHLAGNVRIGELHDEANELRAEVEALRAAIADVHAAYAHSQQQFVGAQEEVEALRSKLDQAADDVDILAEYSPHDGRLE